MRISLLNPTVVKTWALRFVEILVSLLSSSLVFPARHPVRFSLLVILLSFTILYLKCYSYDRFLRKLTKVEGCLKLPKRTS